MFTYRQPAKSRNYWQSFSAGSLFAGAICIHLKVSLVVALLIGQFVCLTREAQSQSTPNSQLPLVQQSNLQYLGAFRVPGGQFGPDQYAIFSYTSGVIAYNPDNNSLFMTSMTYDNDVAEISIPPLINSSNLDSLNTATVLQPFVPVLNNLQNNNSAAGGAPEIGGLTVVNGQLIGTEYGYYDASKSAQYSHFYTSSLNLASMKVIGLCNVGANTGLGPGFFGGYMCPVPSNWQSDLGAPYLTGLGGVSIVSRTSCGPALFGFDPSKLSISSATSAIPYVYYQTGVHPTIGEWNSSPPTEFNSTGQFGGVFFVPGARSVLVFGSIGKGPFCYGEPSQENDGLPDCNDPCIPYKGCHSMGGNYTTQVWAYDANDFVAAKNGTVQPWQVVPYAVWDMVLPFENNCNVNIGGVAYDSTRGILYLTQLKGDEAVAYSELPLVHAFKVAGMSAPPTRSAPTSKSPAETKAAQRAAEAAARREAQQRAAAAKAAKEAAMRKAREIEAAKKAAEEALKQKLKQEEEAARRKAQEEAVKKRAEEEALKQKLKQEEESAKATAKADATKAESEKK